ncbi:MAG: hypothetical protein ACD_2C00097G0009 [uncultured bacterium (gcode 4)]|uniref:Uncharacterized protein n=1 Tax=uncultured bacterium (gcode 4) TaxID=1234023 RepID=K2FEZ2_9BACT|nr:MAG: hypothetical protein ACD_2C00097G0009 [uncultured bacterium (gcode 4)]
MEVFLMKEMMDYSEVYKVRWANLLSSELKRRHFHNFISFQRNHIALEPQSQLMNMFRRLFRKS